VPDFLALILVAKPEAGRKMHLPSGLFICHGQKAVSAGKLLSIHPEFPDGH
jgi:hypothetical protein